MLGPAPRQRDLLAPHSRPARGLGGSQKPAQQLVGAAAAIHSPAPAINISAKVALKCRPHRARQGKLKSTSYQAPTAIAQALGNGERLQLERGHIQRHFDDVR